MDAVSIAIIVTVLSLGSALVYLFKSDHERRQLLAKQQRVTSSNTKKSSITHVKPVKTQQNSTLINHSKSTQNKQVPSIASSLNGLPLNQTTGKQLHSNEGRYSSSQSLNNNGEQKLQQKGGNTKLSQNKDKRQTVSNEKLLEIPFGIETTFDELDSSILMSVFSPASSKPPSSNGTRASSRQNFHSNHSISQPERKSSSRKRRVSQDIMNNNDSSYSSEQLFNLIAASNLSREEVEMAIETLINKLESASESTWKQPKSDPLHRLKNQLRDSEAALTTEIQNHEQSRARLQELKLQIQNEKSLSNSNKEELIRVNKELGVVNIALEQTRTELSKLQLLNEQFKEDTFKVINKHEQEKVQLQNMLSNVSLKETELRKELEERRAHLQRYELSNQNLNDKNQELETKLRQLELQLDQIRSSKHHDDYEAGVKISELESDGMRRDKALKDQNERLKEVLDANNLLQKSVEELQLINGRQEDMLKRLRDERFINEASMKRTLCEMEQELKELQSRLSANSVSHEEKLRKEMSQVERELSDIGQREQKLMSEIKELKEGLSALLPNLDLADPASVNPESENWVHHYLTAINQLAKTIDELRKSNGTDNSLDSPSKKSMDKSTITSHRNGSSSPISNGKSTKSADNYYTRDGEKHLVETKLLELNEYVTELENDVKRLEIEKKDSTNLEQYENQMKELKLQKTKLEAQVKFGLDSLRMEQQRVKTLEEELAKFTILVPQKD